MTRPELEIRDVLDDSDNPRDLIPLLWLLDGIVLVIKILEGRK